MLFFDEGRGSLRKVLVSWQQALIQKYPNGETRHSEHSVMCRRIHSPHKKIISELKNK